MKQQTRRAKTGRSIVGVGVGVSFLEGLKRPWTNGNCFHRRHRANWTTVEGASNKLNNTEREHNLCKKQPKQHQLISVAEWKICFRPAPNNILIRVRNVCFNLMWRRPNTSNLASKIKSIKIFALFLCATNSKQFNKVRRVLNSIGDETKVLGEEQCDKWIKYLIQNV